MEIKRPILKAPKGGGTKETPNLFRKKNKATDTEVKKQSKSAAFTEDQLVKTWEQFGQERKVKVVSEMEQLILGRRITKQEDKAVVHLNSALELAILERMEHDLTAFLRERLENDSIVIGHEVKDEEVKQKLYTSQDKFDYMVEQNPKLKMLKERLGLDFEY